MNNIRAVFFDLGGTLLDETSFFEEWADWLNVDRGTFLAALEELIANGDDHRLLFERFSPDVDLDTLLNDRQASGTPARFLAEDLYPGSLTCIQELRELGYIVGVAGNQSMFKDDLAKSVGLEVQISRAGDAWKYEKPDSRFFDRLVSEAGVPAGQIAYVGDRVDNDILPAKQVGLRAVLVTTGPWGRTHVNRPEAQQADAIIDSLTQLPEVLQRL